MCCCRNLFFKQDRFRRSFHALLFTGQINIPVASLEWSVQLSRPALVALKCPPRPLLIVSQKWGMSIYRPGERGRYAPIGNSGPSSYTHYPECTHWYVYKCWEVKRLQCWNNRGSPTSHVRLCLLQSWSPNWRLYDWTCLSGLMEVIKTDKCPCCRAICHENDWMFHTQVSLQGAAVRQPAAAAAAALLNPAGGRVGGHCHQFLQ